MPPRIKLRTQFSIFLIAFTGLLLTSLLAYLYFSGVNSLKQDAVRELNSFHSQLQINIKNSINSCLAELNSLLTSRNDLKKISDDFIINSSQKYRSISIIEPDKNLEVLSQPVKLLGGMIKTKTDSLQPYIEEGHLSLDALSNMERPRIIGPLLNTGNRYLYIYLPYKIGNKIIIKAIVSLDYLIKISVEELNLPENYKPIITDINNNIIYSPDPQTLNLNITSTYPLLRTKGSTRSPHISGKSLWKTVNMEIPALSIILLAELHTSFSRLHNTLLNMIFFAIIILLIVLLVVRILSNRLTKTIIKISSVTEKVSNGDFSSRIHLERHDEFGDFITVFNQMVDRLSQSYQNLDSTNRELQTKINELIRTRAELSRKERLALIGETISKISHEIQNKIGGVSIWVQNLEFYAEDDETIGMYTAEMKRSLQSFMAMLSNFKRFYREPQLNLVQVHIPELFEGILRRFNHDLLTKSVKIEQNYYDDIPIIRGDIDQLEDMFANIFINALYYSPENSLISLSITFDKTDIFVTISNQGKMIKPEDAEKIFQPFFTTKTSGSGLGLAIGHNIIKAHQGSIKVDLTIQNGAAFIIRLPLFKHGINNENYSR